MVVVVVVVVVVVLIVVVVIVIVVIILEFWYFRDYRLPIFFISTAIFNIIKYNDSLNIYFPLYIIFHCFLCCVEKV